MQNPHDPLAITPEEATEFYRVLGRALWALGAFEYYVVYYIVVVLRGTFDTMAAAERELDRAFALTLGNLLREFRKYRDLSPDLDRRLDAFKIERDWLCHLHLSRSAQRSAQPLPIRRTAIATARVQG